MDGSAKADKKASRTAAEGVLAIAGNDQSVAIVELNSETDFVAKGDDFRALARKAAEVAHAHKPADAAALSQLKEDDVTLDDRRRSEEHTSELQSIMRTSYAVFCLKNKQNKQTKI